MTFEADREETNIDLSCGVPQGSVLGPTLWNILYDGLLRVRLNADVSFLAFADDVAINAKAKEAYTLEIMLSDVAERTRAWLTSVGLVLAIEKSETIIFTSKCNHNEMLITIDGIRIGASSPIKYLGVLLDFKLNFTKHVRATATKADRAVQKIGRILSNINAATLWKRRLLGNVPQSLLLYWAPVWADRISSTGKKIMLKVQRRTALRVASLYSTVSLEISQVLANLLAAERKEVYDFSSPTENSQTIRTRARANLLQQWQRRWNAAETGRWTHRLLNNIIKWKKRKHGEICFYLSQVFSGHGCFPQYIKRFRKLLSSECWYCGHQIDDAYHTIFICDAWYGRRRRLEMPINADIDPDNLVDIMIQSKENWDRVQRFGKEDMPEKEQKERRRQALT